MSPNAERSVEIAIGRRRWNIVSDDDYLSRLGTDFEPPTVALLDTLFSSGSAVLDVGANIGCTSILFGQRARRVIAFEPSPTTFRYLQRNIENAALPNVELHNLALGATEGTSQLT